jgi:hypothetical protein
MNTSEPRSGDASAAYASTSAASALISRTVGRALFTHLPTPRHRAPLRPVHPVDRVSDGTGAARYPVRLQPRGDQEPHNFALQLTSPSLTLGRSQLNARR